MAELKKKIADWLEKSGYPLEMEVAMLARDAGYDVVIPAEYYRDPETDKYREIDVLAWSSKFEAGVEVVAMSVFECKNIKDKPWLVFAKEQLMHPSVSVYQQAHFNSDSILRELAQNPAIQAETIFKLPSALGYGIVTALKSSGDRNKAYDTLQSAVGATLGAINLLTERTHRSKTKHFFAFPIVVVDGRLFQCEFDPDFIRPELDELTSTTIDLRLPRLASHHSFIRILTIEALREGIQQYRESLAHFVEAAWKTAVKLKGA